MSLDTKDFGKGEKILNVGVLKNPLNPGKNVISPLRWRAKDLIRYGAVGIGSKKDTAGGIEDIV